MAFARNMKIILISMAFCMPISIALGSESSAEAVNESSTIFLGKTADLQIIAKHIHTDTMISSTGASGQHQSAGFTTAYKMNSIGVVNLLYIEGESKPYPSLKDVIRVKVSSKHVTERLKSQIQGYNHFMYLEYYSRKKK